ncbi:MAG: hypothetical protein A3F83_02875 [Candidatus Glassbacteria bacterium RIFCSPLOWO2_12_FULL_58_11]|uniref:Uncharacterized protein n=1 Tax=Candidatus Glassbacteria bacterium RIFCSPLOWO2_12_FULL_58_11 TaxID=1817867 RepID=A0A1F5YL96_9BACT|nr:MAG: hypothetical protein A3F83_02875 [Candidatus Glassbacteria bacterium RIFCSPLOWO2_12_FULL_58_11]
MIKAGEKMSEAISIYFYCDYCRTNRSVELLRGEIVPEFLECEGCGKRFDLRCCCYEKLVHNPALNNPR